MNFKTKNEEMHSFDFRIRKHTIFLIGAITIVVFICVYRLRFLAIKPYTQLE